MNKLGFRLGAVGAALIMLLGAGGAAATSAPQGTTDSPGNKATTDVRGEWISSVENLDWPSKPGLSADEQKAELTAMLDKAVENKLNTVMFQIRPTADALWPSDKEPWSHWLTGTQGKDPGYDPLAFAVEEAHKRDLQLHAWFNPYRVSQQADPNQLVPEHPARKNPDWTFEYGDQLYYNPGVPEARAHVEDAIMDAVSKYDIDGVHLDDYFYPYPLDDEGPIPDEETYKEHGGDFANIEDWRRDNINLLVSELDKKIHEAKPDAKFGISPFGIWRNKSSDPNGSDTTGMESYNSIYADTYKWVKKGWVDYINPQIYWHMGQSGSDYAKLVPWWAKTVDGTDVELYVGQGAYKIGDAEGWEDSDELSQHLTFNKDYPQISGDVFFSAKSLTTNAEKAMAKVVEDHYAQSGK